VSYTKGQRVRIINPASCWDSRLGTVVNDDGELVEVDIPGRDFTYSFKHTDIEPATAWRTDDEKCRRCGAAFKHSDALREHWDSEHREEAMQPEEIEIGDLVRVTRGKYQGQTGIVTQLMEERVAVDLGDTKVAFIRLSLEKVPPAVPKNPEPEVVHPTRATIIREDGKPTYIEFEADGRLLVAGYLYPTAQEAQEKTDTEIERNGLKVGDRVRSTSPFFHQGETGVVTHIPKDENRVIKVRLDTARPGEEPTIFYATSLVRIDDGPT